MPNKPLSGILAVCFMLLIAPFITHCVVNDRSLGKDFVTEDYILKIAADEFKLEVTNAYPDSVQGFSNSTMLVGYIKDDLFGYAESSAVTYVLPSADSLEIGANAKLKDAYIYMSIDSTHSNMAGQEGILQNMKVYRLKKDIDTCTIHNTSFSMKDVYDDPISIGSPVYIGGDSLKIRITDSFAEELLKTTYEESNDLDLFKDRIKGVYITCGEIPATIPNGGRMNYFPLGHSRFYIHYTYTPSSNSSIVRDSVHTFYCGAEKVINLYRTNSQHLANDNLSEKIYFEGMSGIKPFVSVDFLKKTLDQWMEEKGYKEGSVIISRASVYLPYEMPEDYSEIDRAFPKSIYPCTIQKLYKETQTTDYFSLPEEVFSVFNTGAINRTKQQYKLDITSYIQNLLRKEENIDQEMAKDLWFFPLLTQFDKKNNRNVYQVDVNSCTRAILNGTEHERAPKLEIIYSVVRLKD